MKMNPEMMQKLIEFGARQERSRNEFIAELITQSIPANWQDQPTSEPTAKPAKVTARRGRKPNPNGLTAQIKTLLGDAGGTVENIAAATGHDGKKVAATLNNMRMRGIVFKVGQEWHLLGGNGAAVSA